MAVPFNVLAPDRESAEALMTVEYVMGVTNDWGKPIRVLAQRENEDWKLVEEGRFRPTGGDFQGIRVYRSDRGSCG
jgi:hypothetical protein